MQEKEYHKSIMAQLESKEAARRYYPEGQEPPVQTALDHYAGRIFLWDTELVVDALAVHGDMEIIDWCAYSVNMLLDGQRQDGFIPNMQYSVVEPGFHVERFTFKNKAGSDYSQPALLAKAIKSIYNAYVRVGDAETAADFLSLVYPKAKLHYEYFQKHQSASASNPLMFDFNPHGTGRDSDFSLIYKLPRWGDKTPAVWDMLDVAQDYLHTMSINVRQRLVGWDPQKARKIYTRYDLMSNCILVTNSLIMAELANEMAMLDSEHTSLYLKDAQDLTAYAISLENQIFRQMWRDDMAWNPKGERSLKGGFFSLDKRMQPVEEVSVGNLMAVTLPHISAKQLEISLNLILHSFNTPAGLSSMPTDARPYDPHNRRKARLWGGSAWPHMMILVAEGLRMQASREDLEEDINNAQLLYLCEIVADLLVECAQDLTKEVYAEFYDPETKEPQRYPKVANFGMAMQADKLKRYGLADRLREDGNYFEFCRRLGGAIPLSELDSPVPLEE